MKRIIALVVCLLLGMSFIKTNAEGEAYPLTTDNIVSTIGNSYSWYIEVVLCSDDGLGSYTNQDSIFFNEDITLDQVKSFFSPKALPTGLAVTGFSLYDPVEVDPHDYYYATAIQINIAGQVPIDFNIKGYEEDIIELSIPASCLVNYTDNAPLTQHSEFSTGEYQLSCTKYDVTYDVQGHGTAPDDEKVQSGFKATKPDDPSESGWVFGGWYLESECENAYDFDSKVLSNLTLYAKWEEYVAPYVPPVIEPVFEFPNTGIE